MRGWRQFRLQPDTRPRPEHWKPPGSPQARPCPTVRWRWRGEAAAPSTSVGDPWNFVSDRDPGIRTSNYMYLIRTRLLSSVTLRMQKKISCFLFFLFTRRHIIFSLPTPDPTPFCGDFKMILFSYNLPASTLSSVLNIYFFAKILC